MTKRWFILLQLLVIFVRAAVMKDDEFKTFLRRLDRRPPAQRVAHLLEPTPDPWDRPDANLADEILENIRKEPEPAGEIERRRHVKSIVTDREMPGKAKNELRPRSILRREAQEAPSRKTIRVNDTRPKSVRLVEPSIVERAMTL